jgi:hypothetical protein
VTVEPAVHEAVFTAPTEHGDRIALLYRVRSPAKPGTVQIIWMSAP